MTGVYDYKMVKVSSLSVVKVRIFCQSERLALQTRSLWQECQNLFDTNREACRRNGFVSCRLYYLRKKRKGKHAKPIRWKFFCA